MTENEFVYKRLKYLNDQIEEMTDSMVVMQDSIMKLATMVNKLTDMVVEQGSPEYIAKANKVNEAKEVMEKAKYFRDLLKNNK